MKSTITTLVVAGLSAFVLTNANAEGSGIKDPLGIPVAQSQAERTVHVDGKTHFVNVMRMENVRFVIGNGSDAKSFTWRFDGVDMRPFKLGQIAPAGALAQDVTVYIAPNEQLIGG